MLKKHFHKISTVWHGIFAVVYAGGLAIFYVLWELIFAIRTAWFFCWELIFCDFQKVYPVLALIIFY